MRIAAALSVACLSSACAAPPRTPPPPMVGMANPASVDCVRKGGDLQIRDTPGGQIGVCVFADGRRCEEWALFRDGRCVAPPASVTPAP